MKSSINRSKKFRHTRTVDRRQGSGRPRSARTDENIVQVNGMVLNQEGQPRTHSTVREISRGQAFLKSSVVRIIKKSAVETESEKTENPILFTRKISRFFAHN